ncbi:hypothetical protein RB653_004305 [Dictyostelium firmibasis]|uniref:Uncharacterized protein n=1 Tax=Dictyostelium firmibasis TaxID=79012 RepID=A0AAN7UAA3_9MYCE
MSYPIYSDKSIRRGDNDGLGEDYYEKDYESFTRTQLYQPVIQPLQFDEDDLNIIAMASNNLTTHARKSSLESPIPPPLHNVGSIKKSISTNGNSFSTFNRNQSSHEYKSPGFYRTRSINDTLSSSSQPPLAPLAPDPITNSGSGSLGRSNQLKKTSVILNNIPENSVLETPPPPSTSYTSTIVSTPTKAPKTPKTPKTPKEGKKTTTTITTATTSTASVDQELANLQNLEEKKQSSFKKNFSSFINELNGDSPIAVVVDKDNLATTITNNSSGGGNDRDKLKESRTIKKHQSLKKSIIPPLNIDPTTGIIHAGNRLSILNDKVGDTGPIPNVDQPSMFSIKDTTNIFDYKKPVISSNTKEFIVCLKRVLIDKDRIMERNDQSLRTVIYKLFYTIKKLHQDGSLNILFDDLRLITEIVIRSGYFIQIFRSFFKLIDEVKTSEVFFSFLSECRHMVDIINLIIKAAGHGNETQTRKMIYIEEDHRKILLKQIKYLIQILLQNEELISLVRNISNLKKQVDIAKEEQRKAFPYDLKENLKYAPFTNELICAAQSIVGEKVNIRNIFANLNQAITYIGSNRNYKRVIKEFSTIIRRIYSTEESNLNIELETQTRQAMDKLEIMIIEVCSLPSLVEVRVQLTLLISSFMSDPINEKLIHDIKDLFNSLKSEKIGKKIDINIFRELKLLVFPYLIHNIHKISIPNIVGSKESSKKKIEYRLENINLILTKIDPNDLKIKLISSVETAPLVLKGCIKSILSIELTNVQFRLDQVEWYFKKSSFPKIKDNGLVNISTGGDGDGKGGHGGGVDIKLKLSFSPKILDSKHCFQILKSKCKINDIHINILNSNHNGLYKTIYKLFKKKIKKSIEDAISEQIKIKVMELDRYIYDLFLANDKPTVDKNSIKKLNKIKREKILERIVTEIPTSIKSSRRFSLLSFNYPNTNGSDDSPTNLSVNNTPRSTSSKRSLDDEIEEFILKEQQRERLDDEEGLNKNSLGYEFKYELNSPSPFAKTASNFPITNNASANKSSSVNPSTPSIESQQRRSSQPDLYQYERRKQTF